VVIVIDPRDSAQGGTSAARPESREQMRNTKPGLRVGRQVAVANNETRPDDPISNRSRPGSSFQLIVEVEIFRHRRITPETDKKIGQKIAVRQVDAVRCAIGSPIADG